MATMKNVFPLIKKNGMTSIAVLLVISVGASVAALPAFFDSIEIAQAQQSAQLKNEFFDLIVKGKFKISDLQAAVKSVVYNEDFKTTIIRSSGTAGYQTNITNSQRSVQQKTEEVKQAQQAIVNFFDEHQDFVSSLSPEVREQAVPIVTLDIPSQIKAWEKEQREQDREWKCSGLSTDPICF